MKMENIIPHPTRRIHPTAQIHSTAVIFDMVTIGENCVIGAFCVIGAQPEHREFWDKPSPGVWIGDNVRITTHVTVDAGTTGMTYIFDNVTLLSKSHVGHDATVGIGSTVSCGAKIGGHVHVGANCNIGLNACIHQRQHVEDGCMIGANAFVSKTLITEPYRKYAGVPARDIGSNAK